MISQTDYDTIFADVRESWKTLILTDLKPQFDSAIAGVNALEQNSHNELCPSKKLMMNAFKHFELSETKVVILGQDPYPTKGHAMGLSFSVNRGIAVSSSLKNIYLALCNTECLRVAPTHGDWTEIAKQGVLLLNAALTTTVGKSDRHTAQWLAFTRELLRRLPPGTPLILLGVKAQAVAATLSAQKFEYGHPSPVSNNNKSDNPKHFKYCKAFLDTNTYLSNRGTVPINWNVLLDSSVTPIASTSTAPEPSTGKVVTTDLSSMSLEDIMGCETPTASTSQSTPKCKPANCVHIFTDGAAKANGKPGCVASWGIVVKSCENEELHVSSGLVEPVGDIKPSNNRGELMAIWEALKFINLQPRSNYVIVSDSDYSIKSITTWAKKWKKESAERMNLDMIYPAHELYEKLLGRVSFRKVRSHIPAPADVKSYEYYLWAGNDRVDKIAQNLTA